VVIPGRVNRVASAFMSRVLPRRSAISIMARNTGDLVPAPAAPATPDKPPTKDTQ
jgi:hypothetical protein